MNTIYTGQLTEKAVEHLGGLTLVQTYVANMHRRVGVLVHYLNEDQVIVETDYYAPTPVDPITAYKALLFVDRLTRMKEKSDLTRAYYAAESESEAVHLLPQITPNGLEEVANASIPWVIVSLTVKLFEEDFRISLEAFRREVGLGHITATPHMISLGMILPSRAI